MTLRNSIPLLGSFSLALVLHGFWFSISLESPQSIDRPTPARVTAFFEELPGGWSPTLFSLPSPTGFSGAMKDNRLRTAPPLQSPLDLTESIRIPVPKFSLRPESTLEMPRNIRGRALLSTPLPAMATPGREKWSISFPDAPELEPRLSRLPENTPENVPFRVSGSMSFDASGRLVSLLVDPASQEDAADLNSIHVLRRVQVSNATPGEWVRFHFTFATRGTGQ